MIISRKQHDSWWATGFLTSSWLCIYFFVFSETSSPFTPCTPQTWTWTSSHIRLEYLWTLKMDRCIVGTLCSRPARRCQALCINSVSAFVQVSFYNVNVRIHIYTFNASFGESIYPFFSPCSNKYGKNDGPLTVTPVNLMEWPSGVWVHVNPDLLFWFLCKYWRNLCKTTYS